MYHFIYRRMLSLSAPRRKTMTGCNFLFCIKFDKKAWEEI